MMSDRLSTSLNNGVPQVGKKRRRTRFPLSDVLTYSLILPVSLKPSVLKIALIEALPDDKYWQFLHHQARVATGSRSNWNWTAPQKHRPVTGFTILNTLPWLAQAK
jgi:hypothetical protein